MNPNFIEEEVLTSSFRSHADLSNPYPDELGYLDMENFIEFDPLGEEPRQETTSASEHLESVVGGLSGISEPFPSCQKIVNTAFAASSQSCSPLQGLKVVAKEQIVSSPHSPSQFSDDDDDWEEGLSSLVESPAEDQGVVPNMDPKTLEMLLTVPIKDFNSKTKTLKIDANTLQHLKACRKRRKNRDAAIRSRSRKEQELVNLRFCVERLQKENEDQKRMIADLLARVGSLPSTS